MKRALIVFFAVLSLPLLADEREVKRALIAELFEVIDVKATIQASIERMFAVMHEMGAAHELEMSEKEKTEWQAIRQQQQRELALYRTRLFEHLDYEKLAETVYAPAFEENFSADDLRVLIAFAKTKPGQRFVQFIPEMGMALMARGTKLMEDATQLAQDEMQREEEKKKPWLKTMNDMRTIATAAEARWTDTNDYPIVSSLAELEKLLAPVYIKALPKTDVWGTEFLFISNGVSFRVVSAGADKRFEASSRQLDPLQPRREAESLDADIIYQDDLFVQYPKDSGVRR